MKTSEELKKRKEYNRARRAKLREQLFEVLGEECARCGFSDKRALQVDHIDGRGTEERKKYKSNLDAYYRKIIQSNGVGYQLLCANCNQIKRHEDREFAHRELMSDD